MPDIENEDLPIDDLITALYGREVVRGVRTYTRCLTSEEVSKIFTELANLERSDRSVV
jgi:hypothetical protein